MQAKHFSGERRSLRLSDISGEVAKARKLVSRGLADNYILMTNASVTGDTEADIRAAFLGVGVHHAETHGAQWIEQRILESPRLRALIPRLYGLGDLTQILDERAYAQASSILETMAPELARFVPTATYQAAVRAFDAHRFVLLTGEPAAGKTTIAYTLALFAADRDGARVVSAKDLATLRENWSPNEPQVLIVDDAFGVTQYQPAAAEQWNRSTHALAAILKNSWVICTSRDYIYRQAREDLKQTAFPLLKEAEVVVDVENLSPLEKHLILYNHMKMGDQEQAFRAAIRPFLPAVATNPRFQPEIARRLGTRAFTTALEITDWGLTRFVEHPREFLLDTIRGMDDAHRSALILLYWAGGRIPSPITEEVAEESLTNRLGLTIRELSNAFRHLEGTFVRLVSDGDDLFWRFRHPTILDATSLLVRDDVGLLDIYLRGASTMRILGEVVCGQVDVPGATVRVPRALFPLVVERIGELIDRGRALNGYEERVLYAFLTGRCSKDFLSAFLDARPAFLETAVDVGSYLYAMASPAFIRVVAAHGLLPAELRAKYVERIRDLAVEVPDSGWITVRDVAEFLTPAEADSIRAHVRLELAPRIRGVASDLTSEARSMAEDEDGFEYELGERIDELTAIRDALLADSAVDGTILAGFDEAIQSLEDARIDGLDQEFPRQSQRRASEDTLPEPDPPSEMSSIFDDVDE